MALVQAEEVIEDKRYEEQANHALVAATIANVNRGKRGKKMKITDIIGEPPWKEREKKRKKQAQEQEKLELDNETLRQIALNKGLSADF